MAATHGRSFWILDDVTALRGLADGAQGHAPVRAAHGDPHQAALERRRQRAHRHRLRSRLRHRRQHGDGRAGRRHALSRASRCRREPAQRRHRLLLAGGGGQGRGDAHLPRFGRAARSSTARATTRTLPPARRARHQARAQPLRLGHEVSRADQARLRPGAAAAQAAGARSREPAGPDGGARHLRRRSDRGREAARRQSAKFTRGQGPAAAHHAGRVRRAVRPAQGADRVGVQAEAGGQSPAQDEAPARGGDRPSRQGRARAARTAPRRSSASSRRSRA